MRYDIDVLMDERYKEIVEFANECDMEVDDLIEELGVYGLANEIGVSNEELDAVVLGEAPTLNAAKRLINGGGV